MTAGRVMLHSGADVAHKVQSMTAGVHGNCTDGVQHTVSSGMHSHHLTRGRRRQQVGQWILQLHKRRRHAQTCTACSSGCLVSS